MAEPAGLRVDGARLWGSLMAMAEIGASAKGGSNRLALSTEDGDARRLLASWCENAGAKVSVDAVGNMFGRHAGLDNSLPPVLIGSHLDTQPDGGRFDGVLGVLAALEVQRTLEERDIRTKRPIELVNWTNEEGARFAPAMTGSGVFAGVYEPGFALGLADAGGKRFGDELARIGFAGDAEARPRPIAAYFELQIEQGPVLEAEGLDIGVVTHAQGVRWIDVAFTGFAGHAGTMPMAGRRDALLGAARAIDRINAIANAQGRGAVATVGVVRVKPGSRNVIPGSAVIGVDLRNPDDRALGEMEAELRAAVAAIAGELGLGVAVRSVVALAPVVFDQGCVRAVRRAADQLGLSHRDFVSGAGHDACDIARIAPAAMIFCPCVGGISHNEAEDIRPEWATAGANVLLHAALDAAGFAG